MKKRFILSIVSVCLAFLIAVSGLTVLMIKTFKFNNEQKALKAEQEKTFIAELFHDQGSVYMNPLEPKKGEDVILRLRTKRYNVTRAQVQYTYDNGVTWKTADMKYDGKDESQRYDMWKGNIKADGELLRYRFIASNADSYNTVYYDTKAVDITEGNVHQCWQIVPGHTTPDWAKGALWYSILPDAFYNGNTTNDKQTSGQNTYLAWNKLRKDLSDKYGGDLQGIEKKLDYIKELGADAIYINPIHKSYQNAGYGPVRYDEVESSFGNEQDLKSLSDAVHEKGLKLMGDVVLTFALSNSYYFNKAELWPTVGAYQDKESKWYDLFKFYNWPENCMIAWSSPATNLNTDIARNLFYAKKDSYLTHYEKYFDGYRFDCGGWLWGTTETDNVNAVVFAKEIREALKKNNNDFLMIAESDWTNMNTNSWDAAWNIGYMPKLQDYAKGLINETLMLGAMTQYEMTIPRNVALCMMNMLSDHDSTRVNQEKDHFYNAAVLIQMTYLGAPSVFYGEEVNNVIDNETGIGTTQSFYSMDWDESNWDKERLAFYRSVAELRKEYQCLKTGVVKILNSDINNNSISFARWDEEAAAITVTSQNEDVTEMEVNVGQASIKDGTILTDWFTGNKYTVKDGKVTVDVIPGGTVLVTGGKASSYRSTFKTEKVGNASGKNTVVARDTLSFTVEGKGKLDGKKDNLSFSSMTAYNDIAVSANIKGDKSAALIIRDSLNSDAVTYAAIVKGDSLSIVARSESGNEIKEIVKTDCSKNTYVKLLRDGKNGFSAYTAVAKDGVLGKFEEIKDSKVYLPMNEKVYYGFSPLKGEMKINNFSFQQGSGRVTFDDFEGEVPSSMFDNITESNVKVEDGKLTLSLAKKAESSSVLTTPMDNDWTFKSKIEYKPGNDSFAGVISKQDDDNYVIVGRRLIDGKNSLFIGKYTNGSLDIYGSAEDKTGGKAVTVQLQRMGGYYSAVYSADDGKNWHFIGKMFANFASESVGLLVSGEDSLTADYVSFGDSINDGTSTNTPYAPVDNIDTSYTNALTTEEAKYEFVSGDWSFVTGGWHQANASAQGIAAATNQEYSDLYAEATLSVDGGGFVGIGFGRENFDDKTDSGYTVKLYKNGILILADGTKILAETKVKFEEDNSLRIVLQAGKGNIKVYTGQNPKVALSVQNTGYNKGYVAFCTENAKGDFKNFHIGHTSANWVWVSGIGSGSGTTITTDNYLINGRQIHSIATLAGYGFTDFAFSAKISNKAATDEGETFVGVLFAAGEGRSDSSDGVLVGINREQQLVLSVYGDVKASYQLAKEKPNALILVVKQAGSYKVFLDGKAEPVLSYEERVNRGGVLSLYSYNAQGCFTNVMIDNLQPNGDYTKTATAEKWNKNPSLPFSDNFSSAASEDNYKFYNENLADFSVKNGTLVCEDTTSWEAGATVIKNSYSDFTMDFKLKIVSSANGWMSIGLRKQNPIGNHNNSGVSIMVGPSGGLFFFDSETRKQYSNATYTGFELEKWYDVKIVANGENITMYVNGKKMMSYTDKQYYDGFISFTSGMTNFEIDDLRITPKK